MATLSQILGYKWPGAEWSMSGDEYGTLAWLGGGKPPSEDKIRAFSSEVDVLMMRDALKVTPLQFRLALDAAGLLDKCEEAVAAAPRSVQISWEYAVTIERLNPFINQFAAVIGRTADEVDAIFEAAALIGGPGG